ncbi:hypothetical protein SAMN05660653_01938 [Desulfonatronum thiosulfatophilum]|uniref:Mechanosensitive ion channel n=1 Tax=Desulfonatronum thiosulfatophilum TaxID=617002 RepID=A0A1G6D5R5_9BACT|nr:hypothetical protein [Desulfonatronum thiosulfatophilum]SDB40409.1 hypothetical protein SAMN05660653_01938 [Desulfonatronum thiosulfatophilum]
MTILKALHPFRLLLLLTLTLFFIVGFQAVAEVRENSGAVLNETLVQPAPAVPAEEPAVNQNLEVRLETVRAQLAGIARSIDERRNHLNELRLQAADAQTASERAELEADIVELERLILASRITFESIATGGIDSNIFKDEPDAPFNWQQELFDIIEPFLEQIKGFTEAPRTIERLNRQIAQDRARLNVVERALANIANVSAAVEDKQLLQRLQALEKSWLQRRSDLLLEIELLNFQLRELREEQDTFWSMLHQGLLSFVHGRGLILLLAIVATGGIWFLLQTLPKVIQRGKENQPPVKRKPYARLMTVGYQVFSVLAALCVLLLVLYVSGDWLLLGFAMIILVLIAVGSRTYLPRFMTEVRMLLDMGPVREGERILLNGVPWEIKNLNMYSTLVNPELQGGILRRPLAELSGMVSRPDEPDEPWFPTRQGEFVMLADGTYGQVLLQTPEVVQVKHVGSVRTFSTGSFLGSSPRNLSRNGFGFAVTFGIDYQHQAICLDEVPGVFEAAVTQALRRSFDESLESVLVDFKEAGSSSLDYLIYVMMRGSAAGSYWAVGRIIQQACVQVCNERGWVIPFNQLTVHQGEGFETLRTAQTNQAEPFDRNS